MKKGLAKGVSRYKMQARQKRPSALIHRQQMNWQAFQRMELRSDQEYRLQKVSLLFLKDLGRSHRHDRHASSESRSGAGRRRR